MSISYKTSYLFSIIILYQFWFRMTVIIYFVLHVPSLESLAEPISSLLARPLSASLLCEKPTKSRIIFDI